MAKSGFEKLMEKAGILVPETPEESMASTVGQEERKETNAAPNFVLQAEGESMKSVSGDVITEAYSTLPKSEEDIYIVEDLLKNFDMLPEASKPAVVRSTLETMQKDISKFIMEANTKKTALAKEIAKYSQNVSSEITELDSLIKGAEAEISRCKQEQLNKKTELEKQKADVAKEVIRLEKIIEILGGK